MRNLIQILLLLYTPFYTYFEVNLIVRNEVSISTLLRKIKCYIAKILYNDYLVAAKILRVVTSSSIE